MSDNPLDSIPTFDRVSLRAVLVHEGEDPSDALAQAGLIDAVSVPVVVGDVAGLSGGILGDGATPNVIAVLETEEPEPEQAQSGQALAGQPQPQTEQANAANPSGAAATPPTGPATAGLTEAFGTRPLAPIRNRGA